MGELNQPEQGARRIGAALRAALSLIEEPPNCPRCGVDLKARTKRDEGNRAEAEDLFRQYLARFGREQAIEFFSLDASTLARAIGVLRKIERPGFCSSCYENNRSYAQIEADDRRSAHQYLAAAADEGYSRDAALEMLRQDAPHLLRYARVFDGNFH